MGFNLCVGSDSHNCARLCEQFEEVFEVLKNNGVERLGFVREKKIKIYKIKEAMGKKKEVSK